MAAIAVSVTLSSCLLPKNAAIRKWCKPVSSVTDSTRNDTTSHSSRSSEITDTKIITPETNLETEFNPCDSLGRVNKDLLIKLKGGAGSLDVTSTKNGNLAISCKCDSTVESLRTEVYQKDSVIKVLKERKTTEESVAVIPEEKKTGWTAWVLLAGFGVLFLLYQYDHHRR